MVDRIARTLHTDDDIFKSIVDDAKSFLEQGSTGGSPPHYLLGLKILNLLVTEYNQLYDHYKGVKSINKKLRAELKQSNERERTFLKLLKKTNEYGA
jgi:hypothetical protein